MKPENIMAQPTLKPDINLELTLLGAVKWLLRSDSWDLSFSSALYSHIEDNIKKGIIGKRVSIDIEGEVFIAQIVDKHKAVLISYFDRNNNQAVIGQKAISLILSIFKLSLKPKYDNGTIVSGLHKLLQKCINTKANSFDISTVKENK